VRDARFEGTVGFIGGSERERLADLYSVHVGEARRLAYLLTGSREAAEDLTQDAFIKSFGRLAHLRKESFRPYLRRTVVNLAKMRYRRRDVERRHLGSEKVAAPVAETLLEEDQVLSDALRNLPYRQRAAVVLRFYCDLADEETAAILGCATGTVRSLVSRGLDALRSTMEKGDHDG
jgi:RNA polymerase sigma-70 factor (sigma-E family)